MGFVDYIQSEWGVITGAPAIMTVGAALLVSAAFAAARFLYAARIETAESRLKLSEDRVLQYKEKLEGASPDDARKRMDLLELQVMALTPRRLSEEQKGRLRSILGSASYAVEIAHDAAAGDAKAFAADFLMSFRLAGWPVISSMVMGVDQPPASGVALQVRDLHAFQPAERVVSQALNALGVAFDLQLNTRPPVPNFEGMGRVDMPLNPDVSLLFTTKL